MPDCVTSLSFLWHDELQIWGLETVGARRKNMKKENLQNQIIIYEGDDGLSRIEVRLDSKTVWLTQAQLVDLFQSSKANISEHIKNIFTEKELFPQSTVRNFRIVQKEGKSKITCCYKIPYLGNRTAE